MVPRALSAWCVACLLLASSAAAETLRTLQGVPVEGRLSALYGDLLVVAVPNGSVTLDVNSLDDASTRKVAQFLATPAPALSAWNQSSSKIAKGVAKKLVVLQEGKLVVFNPGSRPEPEFYLVYFGAYWCGPCRRFSPQLVEDYHRLKAVSPDRFELIFVSDDTDSAAQLTYAREAKMPWPMLKFSAASSVPAFEKQRARGIPSLVVLTREGDLLYHSYRGEEYLGPDDPLKKFSDLLASLTDQNAGKPSAARHRLAVAQHVLAAGAGDRPLQPYRVQIDRNRLQTVNVSEITVDLSVDAQGRVTDAEFFPKLDAVTKENLTRNAETWLFLPAVVKGEPQAKTVRLPLTFSPS